MGKKIMITIITVIFVFTSVGTIFAAEQGNKRKGKYTYRKAYKSCHKRGEIDSAAPPLEPQYENPGPVGEHCQQKGIQGIWVRRRLGEIVGKRSSGHTCLFTLACFRFTQSSIVQINDRYCALPGQVTNASIFQIISEPIF